MLKIYNIFKNIDIFFTKNGKKSALVQIMRPIYLCVQSTFMRPIKVYASNKILYVQTKFYASNQSLCVR